MIKIDVEKNLSSAVLGEGTTGVSVDRNNIVLFNTRKKELGEKFSAISENAEPPFMILSFRKKESVDVMIEQLHVIKDLLEKNPG